MGRGRYRSRSDFRLAGRWPGARLGVRSVCDSVVAGHVRPWSSYILDEVSGSKWSEQSCEQSCLPHRQSCRWTCLGLSARRRRTPCSTTEAPDGLHPKKRSIHTKALLADMERSEEHTSELQ